MGERRSGTRERIQAVAVELEPPENLRAAKPHSNHAIVLVSKLHLPTLRALGYARATRPDSIQAVTVEIDEGEVRSLREQWEAREIPVPLTVIASPYREITRPVVEFVKRMRTENPDDIVTVYVPEYVLGHWWEQILHNQSALRLKSRLLYQRGVVVASVPYQLRSAAAGQIPGPTTAAAAPPVPSPAEPAEQTR